jgi:hypothetical protein
VIHVAVIYARYIDMLLRREKRVELRLSRNRIPPFGVASAGHTLYMKQCGGPIRARATITRVECYDGLTADSLTDLKARYNHLVCGPDEAWAAKVRSRYATLMWLDDFAETADAPAYKPFTGNAWQVLPANAAALRSPA